MVLVSIEKMFLKHLRRCFISYPNTANFIKNTPLSIIFSTLFLVFGHPDETLSLVFDILPLGLSLHNEKYLSLHRLRLFLLPVPKISHDLKCFFLNQQNHKQLTALVLAEVFLEKVTVSKLHQEAFITIK